MQDFPFTIRDVASVMNLRVRHRNTVSLDVDCPLCDDHKGKMNLNLQKNVFRCNRCGESGGMLNLYAKALWRGYKNCQKRDHRSHRENRFQKRDAPQKGHGKDRDADYKCRHGK